MLHDKKLLFLIAGLGIILIIILIVLSTVRNKKLPSTNKQASTLTVMPTSVIQRKGDDCSPLVIDNPSRAQGAIKVNKVDTLVQNGATISARTIVFAWDKISKAKSYYVLLSEKSTIDESNDPLFHGKETTLSNYLFTNLKGNTTYYLFVRAKSYSNSLGLARPTMGACNFIVPAISIFQFSTV